MLAWNVAMLLRASEAGYFDLRCRLQGVMN
jgi:hypothetical protein